MSYRLLPEVPDYIYDLYKQLREAPRTGLAYGVLPGAINVLAAYERLEAALNDPADTTFGEYQVAVREHHYARIAQVMPYIVQMQQLMGGLIQIATAIDAASIAAGDVSVFNMQLPVEQELIAESVKK